MSKNGFERPIGYKEAPRLSKYNFNADAAAILSAIGCIEDTKWPQPLQYDPSQRDPIQMCKYHGTHSHRIEDCRQLREDVARLFNNEHLREFLSDRAKNHLRNRDSNKQTKKKEPQHVIHMIIGGVDVPQGPMLKRTKVSITREKQTRVYIPEGTLSFSDKDTEGIMQPHNDALVISVFTNKSQVKHVLIDPGSLANIIRSRVIEQLGLQDQILPAARVLNRFNMACETTKGEITLPINGTGTIHEMKFYVIERYMSYNVLFIRPWIHNMRAALSSLHQVLKFATLGGIKTIYGEQPVAKEMFAVEELILVSMLTTSKEPS
ncbi:uncharacterized protein [Nicotiana sylvestris]|uniref:Uncharacterized protein LOC104246981 n=1 Tax=Nicotiana sylvestris TaxID=4096 RepID=A0A1U7YPP4_NICSY|nr:PREDICTED: uncharacterized protein LOC104246981 [Nicotiana sylvestris]